MFLTVAFVSLTEGIFAMLYLGMSTRSPAAFSEPLSRASAAYFTISTATTTGLGDIHPVTDSARMLVTAQMIVSLVVIAAALGTAFQRSLSRDSPSPR